MQLSWQDYFGLLRWTAQQAFDGVIAKVPGSSLAVWVYRWPLTGQYKPEAQARFGQ